MSFDTLAWARRARTGSPARKALLMVLAEHADEAHSCYPSQALLADATEQSVRTVRRQLAELAELGLIVREARSRPDGSRTSDRFYLLVPDAPPANLTGTPGQSCGQAPRSPVAGAPGHSHGRAVTPGEPPTEQPAEPRALHLANPDDTPSPWSAEGITLAFDAFWRVYPRRTAKADARKAFDKAARKAAVVVIVAGAERYAADPNLPPPEYVPHPATWLNGERWADGPLPPRSNGRQPAPARRPIMANTAEAGGRVLTDAELWED